MIYCPTTGKQAFTRSSQAKRTAAAIARRRRSAELYVYQCQFCRQWHVTSHR